MKMAEELQDQAALHALGLLEGKEMAAFEKQLFLDTDLRELERELAESAALLAWSSPPRRMPFELQERIGHALGASDDRHKGQVRSTGHSSAWIPWAIAALLFVFCGFLFKEYVELSGASKKAQASDRLLDATLVALSPTEEGPSGATATVAWEDGRQSGVLKVAHLPQPKSGRDYQLWAVDADQKQPVSGGLIRVDKKGEAQMRFQTADPAHHVKAFAISLEKAGGSPTKEGPILLMGHA